MCSTSFVGSMDPEEAGGWGQGGSKGGSRGSKGGQGGSKGGTWKFPKLGPTHRWLSVGGGRCTYVCTLCTYIFETKIRSRPMGPGAITLQFFLGNPWSPRLLVITIIKSTLELLIFQVLARLVV